MDGFFGSAKSGPAWRNDAIVAVECNCKESADSKNKKKKNGTRKVIALQSDYMRFSCPEIIFMAFDF